MAVRVHQIYTNFRQGEISPRLMGRIDWERYAAGCVELENFVIQPQGGVTRRPGTRFIKEVKTSANATRLIPFERTSDDVWVLEFGNLYVRFYHDGEIYETTPGNPLELVSPYTTAQLSRIHYKQVEDTLVLTHPSHTPYRLSKYSDSAWKLAAMVFDPPPSTEHGTRTSATVGGPLTRGSGTTNVQFDGTQAIFLASDVGRELLVTSNGLRVTITTVGSTTRVYGDIEDTASDPGPYAYGTWKIDGSPLATVTPSAAGPIGASITLTLDIDGWRAGDVGKYVILSEGVVEITAFTTAKIVAGTVKVELNGVTAQPPYAWSLEEAAWSASNGYPSTVGLCENRLAFGGTTAEKNTVWMSASYDFLNFALGSTDDSAIIVRPSSGTNAETRWFSPGRKFLMGTASDEYTISAANDAALTPTNVRPKPCSPHGSGTLMPLRTEHATLFVTGNGRLVRELAYSYEVDDYRAPNLLDIAEHLTRTTSITDIAFQRPPDGIVWAVRSDGSLLGCTYLRDQDVVGWHRHTTHGTFESVCCIPSTDGTTDEVWVIVNRTIGGATKRYVEKFDALAPTHWTGCPGLMTDSAVTYDSTATATMTGLSHLNGETVSIVGNGAVFPDDVVESGNATLAGGTASKIEAGLAFTSTLQTVRPEIPAGGTGQGRPKAWGPIKCRFENTIGGRIQNEIVTSPTPPVLFTGDKMINKLGWDEDAWITVEQLQPLPMTVLAIFGAIAVGD